MDWFSFLPQTGALVIVAWIVHYIFSVGMPDLNDRHGKEMASQREAHERLMTAQLATHERVTKEQRDAHIREMEGARLNFLDAIKDQREAFRAVLAEERAQLDNVAKITEEHVRQAREVWAAKGLIQPLPPQG